MTPCSVVHLAGRNGFCGSRLGFAGHQRGGLQAVLCGLGGRANLAFDHAEDIGFLEDQPLFAVDHHVCARPLAEQDAITGADVERNERAVLVARASTDGLAYRIALLRRHMGMDVIIPYVLWVALLLFLVDLAMRLINRKLHPWFHEA